jgi:hypothetical protein
MEAVCSFETLVSTYKFTQRSYPEDQHNFWLHKGEKFIEYLSDY